MNKKSGYALRIVLGGYLTYLGIRILSEMIQQRPSNMTLMSVLAVVFILVGVAYAGNAICKTFEIDIKKQIAKDDSKEKSGAETKSRRSGSGEGNVTGNREHNDRMHQKTKKYQTIQCRQCFQKKTGRSWKTQCLRRIPRKKQCKTARLKL